MHPALLSIRRCNLRRNGLKENFQLSAPVLLKKIENQLLLSDLGTSTLQHDGLFPANDEQTDVFFADVKGSGVLVQVVEILEIGRPALELLKLHRDKVEDRKVLREQGRTVIRAVNDVDPTQDVSNTNNNHDESAADAPSGKGLPRAMLRLRVSDGFNEYTAIESKRVPDLSMDDTALGCKLTLKNIRCLRGVLMLDQTCCIVKGGSIPDLEDNRDAIMEALLKARVEHPEAEEIQAARRRPSPGPRRQGNGAAVAAAAPRARPSGPGPAGAQPANGRTNAAAQTMQRAIPRSGTSGPPRPRHEPEDEDDFGLDDDFDEEALAVLQEAEAAEAAVRTSKSSQAGSGRASAKPTVAGPSRTRASAAQTAAKEPSSGTQTSGGPPRKPARAAQVIDLDDSDEEEDEVEVEVEVEEDASTSFPDRRFETGRSAITGRQRISRPIEID